MKTRILAILLCTVCLFTSISYAQNALTAQQWQDDVRQLQSIVHDEFPFLFKKVTAKEFDAAVEDLYNKVPELKEHEIRIGLTRLVAMFKYGHTQIPFSTSAKNGILPINLYEFNDGMYIEGVHKDFKDVLGAKVIKIGNTPIKKAIELVYPAVPVENDYYFKAYGVRFLLVPDVLHAQGVIDELGDKVTFTLEKEGKTFDYAFPTIALDEKPRIFDFTLPTDNWITARDTTNTPLYLKYYGDKSYFFEYLEDAKLLYVRQSSVFSSKEESLPDFYKRLFAFIDANEVDKLVYDVRLNGGGNNYNNMPLIKGLMARPKINQQGKFFFIIGRNTFSACQNLTNEISRYTEAIIVGEPTAENENFYGDNKGITLHNSGIRAYLSFAWWQDFPQWEGSDATYPHLAADMSFNDYITNNDTVLQKALKYTEDGFILRPMQHLTQLFVTQNFEQLKKDAHKIAKNPEYKYYDFQKEFNNAGQLLLNQGNKQGALFIYDLLAEVYPESVSAFYSLANLQADMKLYDKAKASFERIIELKPEGMLAKTAKARIEAMPKE